MSQSRTGDTSGDDALVPDQGASRSNRRSFLLGSAAVTAGAVGPYVVPTTALAAERAGDGGADWPDGPGSRLTPRRPDAELREILAEVDEDRIEDIVRTLASFGTRHTLSAQDDPNRGIGAARDWIAAEMRRYAEASGGRMTVTVPSYVQEPASRIPTPTRISNVVATLRGDTDPHRVYVVSGHYDSRASDVMDFTSDAPGADDDASGVAVAMELARIMARRRTGATLVFAAVAGEEQGLYGAAFLARQFRESGADVQAMFTNDIIGSSRADDGSRDRHSVRLFAEGPPTTEDPERAETRRSIGGDNDSPARQLARFVSENGNRAATGMEVRVVYRLDRYLRGGDHRAFLEEGFPAARFTEPNEDFAHQHQDVRVEDGVQYGDLPEFCDFGYVAGVARVNAATLWSLAQAPGVPREVVVDTSGLTNDTTLTWSRGSGAGVTGYEVVWRPTAEPFWTHVVDVGDATTATIDLSKDHVIFGVRAVGENGYRSPAVFPFPPS